MPLIRKTPSLEASAGFIPVMSSSVIMTVHGENSFAFIFNNLPRTMKRCRSTLHRGEGKPSMSVPTRSPCQVDCPSSKYIHLLFQYFTKLVKNANGLID